MAIANASGAPEKSLHPSPLVLTLGYLRRNKSSLIFIFMAMCR